MDEQFGDILVLRAIALQRFVLPAHAAVAAILPAKVGNFDNATNENFISEMAVRGCAGLLVQLPLRISGCAKIGGIGEITGG